MSEPEKTSPESRKYRILLTDDDDEFRSILSVWLRDEGFAVTEACCGNEAIALMHSAEFDVIILDIKMPNGSGVDVMRFINRHRPGLHVAVLTGFLDLELAHECQSLGAAFTLRKPYDLQELSIILEYFQKLSADQAGATA